MRKPRLVRDLPAIKAQFWRTKPLYIGTLGIHLHPYLERLFGAVTLSAHRLNTPAGLLGYVADFANGKERAMFPRAMFGASEKQGSDARAIAESLLPELTDERVEAWRERTKKLLEAAVKGGVDSEHGPDFNAQPESMLRAIEQSTQGQIKWALSADRGVGLRVYGNVRGPDAFLAVITGLLLDSNNRDLVSKCANCNRLFVVKRTRGRTRRLNCSSRCMLKVHKANNPERQRATYKRDRALSVLLESLETQGSSIPLDVAKQAVKSANKMYPQSTYQQLAEHAESLLQATRKAT